MEEDKNIKKKKNYLIVGIVLLVIALIGVTYAFFYYERSSDAFVLTSNGISIEFIEGTNEINFGNAYPISNEFALENLDKLTYVDFTVSGEVENPDEGITYEIYLTEKSGNTLSSNYVKLYLTDDNDNNIKGPSTYSSLSATTYQADASIGKVIYTTNKIGTFSQDYRLYVWLDKDYTQNVESEHFTFYVNIYAYNDENKEGAYVLQKKIAQLKEENPTCNYVVEDYDTNEDLEATYLSGPAPGKGDCAIDFNYVWWSGKMWRITAIYPDGAMKMVTDNNITSIAFNASSNVTYYNKSTGAKSYMFQWLNEDFLDTLYNHGEDVIDTTKYWNATKTSSKPSEIDATMIPTTTSPVGILNRYEYYESFQNTTTTNGYLNIGYRWWFITPSEGSYPYVYLVINDGSFSSNGTTGEEGVRPAIYLKPGITLSGNGTKISPYRLSYDFTEANTNDNLYTRHSGEYIKFDTDGNNGNYNNAPSYRIVGVEGEGNTRTTKIVAMDYATYDNNGSPANQKQFGLTSTDVTYGLGTTPTTWDYYLNNDWYDNLSFKNKIESGTYYIGTVGSSPNYKLAVCQSSSDTTAICLSDATKKVTTTFIGNVGLPRYGEMFATQQGSGSSSSIAMWLMTIYSSYRVYYVLNSGYGNDTLPTSSYGVRPSYYLKSTVRILSGSGTELDPYVVS